MTGGVPDALAYAFAAMGLLSVVLLAVDCSRRREDRDRIRFGQTGALADVRGHDSPHRRRVATAAFLAVEDALRARFGALAGDVRRGVWSVEALYHGPVVRVTIEVLKPGEKA